VTRKFLMILLGSLIVFMVGLVLMAISSHLTGAPRIFIGIAAMAFSAVGSIASVISGVIAAILSFLDYLAA
jgi:hypothetical protein